MMRAAILAGLLVVSAPALAQSSQAPALGGPLAEQAVAAWSAGEYGRAVALWARMPNDPDALYNLGQAYRLGRGVPADLVAARRYYEQALTAGHARAAEQLGVMLYSDVSTRAQAWPFLDRAASTGSARARLLMGVMSLERGSFYDLSRARSYIDAAAAANVPGALEARQRLASVVAASGGSMSPPVRGTPTMASSTFTSSSAPPTRMAAAMPAARVAPTVTAARVAPTVTAPAADYARRVVAAPIPSARTVTSVPQMAPQMVARPVVAAQAVMPTRSAVDAVVSSPAVVSRTVPARPSAPVVSASAIPPSAVPSQPAAPMVIWWQ